MRVRRIVLAGSHTAWDTLFFLTWIKIGRLYSFYYGDLITYDFGWGTVVNWKKFVWSCCPTIKMMQILICSVSGFCCYNYLKIAVFSQRTNRTRVGSAWFKVSEWEILSNYRYQFHVLTCRCGIKVQNNQSLNPNRLAVSTNILFSLPHSCSHPPNEVRHEMMGSGSTSEEGSHVVRDECVSNK